jgi:sodium transport system permease protein
LAALRNSLSVPKAIVVSSVLFGLFHVVAIDQLHFERLVPSTLLGLVLGWLCLRCGSALPGIVLHAVHNSLLLLAAQYQKELAAWGLGLDQSADIETAGLPASWLIAATIGTATGLAMVLVGTRRRSENQVTFRN